MEKKKSLGVLPGIIVVLVVVAVIVWMQLSRPERPAPERGAIYYTGPMRSKGNPNIFGIDGGQRVPPPPGVTLPSASGISPGGDQEKKQD